MTERIEREKRRISEVAKEYSEKGYDVTTFPGPSQRPGFLSAFNVDIIAVSSLDRVVIQVKSSPEVRDNPLVKDLATVVDNQPGWRFELVLSNPRSAASQAMVPISGEEIEHRLVTARSLLSQDEGDAALLLIWSALEATIRKWLDSRGRTTDSSLQQLLKTTYSLGGFDDQGYELVCKSLVARNCIAHGVSFDIPRSLDWSELISITNRLTWKTEYEADRKRTEALIKKIYPLVQQAARERARHSGSQIDVDEVTSDSISKLYEYFRKNPGSKVGRLEPLARRTVGWVVADSIRAQRRLPEPRGVPGEDFDVTEFDVPDDSDLGNPYLWALEDALDSLLPDDRKIVRARLKGKPIKEIAKSIGVSEKTARLRLNKAIDAIKEVVGEAIKYGFD